MLPFHKLFLFINKQSIARKLALGFSVTALTQPIFANNVVGKWGSLLTDWSTIPIHAVLLKDGQVLTYGTKANGQQTGKFNYDIWDPITNTHLALPNGTPSDIFCAGQIVLPMSNNVLITGGDNYVDGATTNTGNDDVVIYDVAARQLRSDKPQNQLNNERWYATLTTLPNGEVYVQGGIDSRRRIVRSPEIRRRDGTFDSLTGIDLSTDAMKEIHWWYPRNFVAPNGRIFGFSNRYMYYIDTAGVGQITRVGAPLPGPSGVTSSEVMFLPGKILRVGGGAVNSNQLINGKKDAIVIDINGDSPNVRTVTKMPKALHWHTATVGVDGRVYVTGGSLLNNRMDGANFQPLIWNPNTTQWTLGAQSKSGKARLYHSTALLLLDGSIFVGGGGAGKGSPQTNTNAEIYYPPYLFTASGSRAVQQRLTVSDTTLSSDQAFDIRVDNADNVAKVALIKTGSVTHSWNMDQRYIPLNIVSKGGNLVRARTPANPNVIPPGTYMVFVMNSAGNPSLGSIVSVGL